MCFRREGPNVHGSEGEKRRRPRGVRVCSGGGAPQQRTTRPRPDHKELLGGVQLVGCFAWLLSASWANGRPQDGADGRGRMQQTLPPWWRSPTSSPWEKSLGDTVSRSLSLSLLCVLSGRVCLQRRPCFVRMCGTLRTTCAGSWRRAVLRHRAAGCAAFEGWVSQHSGAECGSAGQESQTQTERNGVTR